MLIRRYLGLQASHFNVLIESPRERGEQFFRSDTKSAVSERRTSALLLLLLRDEARISPDPETEQAILNLPDSHAESCRYFAPTKLADCSIIRPIREN